MTHAGSRGARTPVERPELIELDAAQRKRARSAAGLVRCPSCHRHRFTVGDALYVGFLFVTEDTDAYFLALTCRNPRCPAPRTGVRLRKQDIFATDPSAHAS